MTFGLKKEGSVTFGLGGVGDIWPKNEGSVTFSLKEGSVTIGLKKEGSVTFSLKKEGSVTFSLKEGSVTDECCLKSHSM